MKSLLDLIKALYGPKAISSTIGTRTNVIRLPSGKLQRYLKEGLNIEAASDNAAQNAYNEMKELIPEVAKMNDSERLIFEGNLRRLKNKLEASGILPKQTVTKEAEVVSMETKEPVTGENLKKLIEEKGTVNPPTTLSGQLEGQGKKLENLGKKIDEEFIAGKKKKTAGEILEEYFTSYKSMKEVEDQALVRAVAREIMYRDLKAGKLKVPKDVEDVIRGIGPANRDVLDEFNQWYGFAAIEDLHDNAHRFYTMSSPQEAVDFIKKNKYSNWEQVYQPREKPIKEYMTPGEFQDMLKDATVNKYGMVAPKASESLDKETAKEIYDFYLKSGDRKLIQDEITGITEGKKFDVYKVEDRNKIIDILTDILKKLGPPAVASGVGLEYLAEKSAPAQIEGGTQQSLGLDYLTGMEPSEGYADGGRIGFKTGGGKKILDLINKANKELKAKKSMETVDLKTGEVGPPKEPVMTAENKSRKLTQDEIADYEELIGRDSEQWMSEGTVEEAEKALKRSKAEEAYYRTQYKLGKLDPEPGEQTEARMKFLQKKLEEASEVKDRRLITPKEVEELMELESRFIYKKGDAITEENFGSSPFAPSQETLDNLKIAREQSKKISEQNLENEMNRVLNQYDKSMFIKDAQGMVDVSNPANAEKMALLLKRDHPEIYNKIFKLTEEIDQKQILNEFDVTDRKPNASGGLNYLMGL
jgi:hypothetical protein